MEKSLKIAKDQGLNTTDIEARKAEVIMKIKESKTQASGGDTELFESDGNKKRKRNMLDDNDRSGQLNFQASTAQNIHLPMTLATRSVKDTTISLPVVIRYSDGTSAVLTTNVNEAKTGKSFWVGVKKKLQNWSAIMGENEFEPFRESEKKELQVLAHLLPGLLGVDGRLLYEKPNDRVTKKDYKAYLERIQQAVNRLLEKHKSELIDSAHPMTRQRLATNLHSNTEGMQTMTSYEHAEIMCSMSNFYSCAIETLRRELVSYGAVISNLADVAQKERTEIAIIARNVIAAVPESSTPITSRDATTPDKAVTEDAAGSTRDATTPVKAAATTPTPQVDTSTKDATLSVANPVITETTEAATLSRSWLNFIQAHKCLCENCDPIYHEILRGTMIQDGKELWEAEVTQETLSALKRSLVDKHREEIDSAANKQAREEYEKGVYQKVIADYKGKLMREIGEEWKAKETERIRKEVQQEYEVKLRSVLQL